MHLCYKIFGGLEHLKIEKKGDVPSVCKVESKETIVTKSPHELLNKLISFCKGHCNALRSLCKSSKIGQVVHELIGLLCSKIRHRLIVLKWFTIKANLIIIIIISSYMSI